MKRILLILFLLPLLCYSQQFMQGNSVEIDSGHIYSYQSGVKLADHQTMYVQLSKQTITDTTGEISFFNDTNAFGTRTFPANFFHVGKIVRYQMKGDFSSVGNPLNSIKITLGGVSFISNAVTLGASHSNDYCEIIFDFVCIKTGVNGEFVGEGRTILTGSGESRKFIMTTPVVVNTTIPNTFNCTYTWGIANPANILICVIGILQIFN